MEYRALCSEYYGGVIAALSLLPDAYYASPQELRCRLLGLGMC